MKPRCTDRILLGIEQLSLPRMTEFLNQLCFERDLQAANPNCTPGYLRGAAENAVAALTWARVLRQWRIDKKNSEII